MYRIGIECESIEDRQWGVGRLVAKLLENIAQRPELAREFRFFLYFKSRIPDLPYFDNPIFVKRLMRPPILPASFSLYYYILLPIRLWFEGLDLMFWPNYMLPIIARGRSLAMLTEDVYYEIRNRQLPFRYRLAYKIFANWAARHATAIMAISETSKKEVASLFKIDPQKIFVNPLGVDMVVSPRAAAGGLTTTRSNYILYVGQAFPRRHLRETILAFEQIALRFQDLQLIAVGYDKYNPPIIKNLVKEVNRRLGRTAIIHHDYVSEVELRALYQNAKLLVYVSSKEAFGLPPLEALSYGVPPVVADSPLNHEIYQSHAFLVSNPDNHDSIAQALVEGLTNESKRREIINAAGNILQKYTWQKFAERFLKIACDL